MFLLQIPALLIILKAVLPVKLLPVTKVARQYVVVFYLNLRIHVNLKTILLLSILLSQSQRLLRLWSLELIWHFLFLLLFVGIAFKVKETIAIEPGADTLTNGGRPSVASLNFVCA